MALAAATAAAKSTAATTTAAKSTPTAATLRLRPSFVHIQCAPFKIRPVQRRNGLICLLCVRHFHERKPTRAARIPIRHDIYTIHRTVRFK